MTLSYYELNMLILGKLWKKIVKHWFEYGLICFVFKMTDFVSKATFSNSMSFNDQDKKLSTPSYIIIWQEKTSNPHIWDAEASDIFAWKLNWLDWI